MRCLKDEDGLRINSDKGEELDARALASEEAEALMLSGVGSSHETTPEVNEGSIRSN